MIIAIITTAIIAVLCGGGAVYGRTAQRKRDEFQAAWDRQQRDEADRLTAEATERVEASIRTAIDEALDEHDTHEDGHEHAFGHHLSVLAVQQRAERKLATAGIVIPGDLAARVVVALHARRFT